jgi:prolyl-tRNA synthetase
MRVLEKIKAIVDFHHEQIGFNRCCAPILHPVELWKESGRYEAYGQEMMRFKDRHNAELILGPTAEEVFVDMVKQNVSSTKVFPINLYNIQWKFRDEIRPRFGIMRCREFLMCDGYSFHLSEGEMLDFYELALRGYTNMFREMGFTPIPLKQEDTGPIGGKLSHEFFALSETGENEIEFDQTILEYSKEKSGKIISGRGIELGHIFALSTKYSQSMRLKVGEAHPYMGCYGVGVSRLVGAALEVFGVESETVARMDWPTSIAPFKVYVCGSNQALCEKIHAIWPQETYWDDRHLSFGEHNAIANMIGAPIKIFVGDKKLGLDSIQLNGIKSELSEVVTKINSMR